MSDEDRTKWNDRYRSGDHASPEPCQVVTGLVDWLPRQGQALDVAGGAGRHALWLAQLGLDVTVADISEVGLELTQQRAAEAGVTVRTQCVDLEREPLPQDSPWDLILCVMFLRRELYPDFQRALAPGGVLVIVQPTKDNLQRHRRPPADFLLEPRELPTLIDDLEIVHYEEDWLSDGRHDAVMVARRN